MIPLILSSIKSVKIYKKSNKPNETDETAYLECYSGQGEGKLQQQSRLIYHPTPRAVEQAISHGQASDLNIETVEQG